MNERIKELKEQAWTLVSEEERANGKLYEAREQWERCDERFAELIVRECMSIADGQKKWVEDMEVFNEQDATWNKARIQQSQQIVDKIKQHFGVEE